MRYIYSKLSSGAFVFLVCALCTSNPAIAWGDLEEDPELCALFKAIEIYEPDVKALLKKRKSKRGENEKEDKTKTELTLEVKIEQQVDDYLEAGLNVMHMAFLSGNAEFIRNCYSYRSIPALNEAVRQDKNTPTEVQKMCDRVFSKLKDDEFLQLNNQASIKNVLLGVKADATMNTLLKCESSSGQENTK